MLNSRFEICFFNTEMILDLGYKDKETKTSITECLHRP